MTISLPRLMDAQMREAARLHPSLVSLTETLAPLSTAEMTLPEGEMPVTVGMFVALHTAAGPAGVYRVESVTQLAGGEGGQQLLLRHGLCTLADDILPGVTETPPSATLPEVMADLLSRQTAHRWRLGAAPDTLCAACTWENENLLTALLSLAQPLTGYMWDFDFSAFPWTLSLVPLPEEVCEIRAGRSLLSARITVDRTDLCTRIYPLGYGEGADQLTIRRANGGTRFLTADTVGVWGMVKRVWMDRSITSAETLKAAAEAVLEKRKHPIVTVEADAEELSSATGEALDRFRLGAVCRMPLHDWGVMVDERVTALHRPDVYGEPTRVTVTLAKRTASAVDEISALARDSSIAMLYAQGAPSESSIHFGDNCDPAHPARLRFFVDEDAVHVNRVRAVFTVEPFRGYAQSLSGGGSGTATTPVRVITQTFATGGAEPDGAGTPDYTDYADGSASHRHRRAHVHTLQLALDIPALEVDVSGHSHATRYGIYETGGGASVAVAVDGTPVPAGIASSGDMDVTDYLARGADGRILRGAWHEITFTPDALARVTADLHVRTFIRSMTGANL